MMTINSKIFTTIVILYFFIPALAQAASYDFFVDKNSSESAENGSEQYPWKTIGAAMSHIRSYNLEDKSILIKEGTYRESVEVSNDVSLFGEGKSKTVIDADGEKNAVSFNSTESKIEDFTIKKAKSTNVIVDKKSKATITNCKIEKAGKFGIEVKESSATDKYKFTIKDSEISENDSKGFHISKRKIFISDNEVSGNGEEGIDLHSGQRGTVSKNNIHGNGESGIEAMLSGANLKFQKNTVRKNHTQGITVQVYSTKSKGKIRMTSNKISENRGNGIRFANYTRSIGPSKFKVFAEKYVKLFKNKINKNGKEEMFFE